MLKRVLFTFILCASMVCVIGCSKDDDAPTINERGELVLVDDDILTISVVEKIDTPLGAGIKLRAINNGEHDIVLQCNETVYKTYVDGKINNPLFSVEIPIYGERLGIMTFIGVTNLNDLVNIEGVFTADSLDFRQEFNKYDFYIK